MAPAQRREQLLDAALQVIVDQGYERVSMEAVARAAGVTRPVVYDHFPNLANLLHTLIQREERYSLDQLADVVPADLERHHPAEILPTSMRRFLEAVASRPPTWNLILRPLDGTPEMVRHHVELNRGEILQRIGGVVRSAIDSGALPAELDVELAARAVLALAEEAGRMVLTDGDRYAPERYEHFVQCMTAIVWGSREAQES